MNFNQGPPSGFRDFTQPYQSSAMSVSTDEGLISNSELRNEARESEIFIPAMTTTYSSSESNKLIGRREFQSSLDESISVLDMPHHFLQEQKYDSQRASSVVNMVTSLTSNSIEMNSIDPIFYTQSECQQNSKFDSFPTYLNDQDVSSSYSLFPSDLIRRARLHLAHSYRLQLFLMSYKQICLDILSPVLISVP